MSFPKPPKPTPAPTPATAANAAMAPELAPLPGSSTAEAAGSLISTSSSGLTRKALTAKKSLIGG